MNRLTSHFLKFVLISLAISMVLSAGAGSIRLDADSLAIDFSKPTREPRHQTDAILFARGPFKAAEHPQLDTRLADFEVSTRVDVDEAHPKQVRVVQFTGPIRKAWVQRLRDTGSEVIGYLPNNAYVIRGTPRQLQKLAKHTLDQTGRLPIGWLGRFEGIYKVEPSIDEDTLIRGDGDLDLVIELIDDSESPALAYINSVMGAVNHQPRRFLDFVVISVTIPVREVLRIASYDEVLYIGRAAGPGFHDERSAQITAANLTSDGTQPSGPGYLDWLASKGLNVEPNELIDFSDSGLDRGSAASGLVHADFRDSLGNSRVSYYFNYSNDGQLDDRRGHGSLVASIASGSGASANMDSAGYLYGLGVDPFTRIGVSRIFGENGRFAFNINFSQVVANAFSGGARISNNSWGTGTGVYDPVAQEYDALTRDAQSGVTGNQQMLFVFSAGNNGPSGLISSPGTAKNVITVGGSENFRPEGSDSCNLDGAGGVGPDGADNIQDLLRFSSRGPTVDGRSKPDLVAPGTHIFGTASQASLFNASGLCPGTPIYQPPGQRLYTWSSGTSLAAAHVSGAASLVRRFISQNNLLGDSQSPSPSMLKAYLINSTSYLTGNGAGGTLPGDRQGWGLVDLSRAFETADRVLIDQSEIFSETGESFELGASVADSSKPVRITLVWTDAPGLPSGGSLVNDLNLEVNVGGTVYRGNHFDGAFSQPEGTVDNRNNVECVFLPPGLQGNLTVTIQAANISGDGVPSNSTSFDQDFALVVYNVTDPVDNPPPPPDNPPVVTSASYVKKTLFIGGRDFTAAAQVEINGRIIERDFTFDSTQNSLRIKLKKKKLNLQVGIDNQIVLIENNQRSQPFSLRL
jgi:hypothetical protein